MMGHDLPLIPIWLALAPPAVYFLAIGVCHLRRRPAAIAGGWDGLVLALAVVAAVVAGPFDLLLPPALDRVVRGGLGLISFVLAALCVHLATRPRLVIYNATLEQVRPIVAEVAAALDPAARWAGETVALPGRDVQVHLDGRSGMRSVSLVAIGSRTGSEGWAEFSRRTRRAVRQLRVRPSPWAPLFLAAGCCLGAVGAGVGGCSRPRPSEPAAESARPRSHPAPGVHPCRSMSISPRMKSPFRS